MVPILKSDSELEFTLPQVESAIIEYQHLFALSPQSDPRRLIYLWQLAALRASRNILTNQKGDIDKAIIHLTEAVLLPFQPTQDVVHLFYELVAALLSRFNVYKQPEDVKSSLKYLRFLRINFHPFDAFEIPLGQFTSLSVLALSGRLSSGLGDMIQDMEDMATLIRTLLTSDISANELNLAIRGFTNSVISEFRIGGAKLPSENVIQVLRETENMGLEWDASFALAHCLCIRFGMAQVIHDYEEAMAIADKIVAAHSGDSTQEKAIVLIGSLVGTRLTSYPSPEYLEEAIHRFRTLLGLPSLPDQDRISLTRSLGYFEEKRIEYFGASGNLSSDTIFTHTLQVDDSEDQLLASEWQMKLDELKTVLVTLQNDEIMHSDASVEEAVKLSRTLLPIRWPRSGDQLPCMFAIVFAEILAEAYARTDKLDFLNESITA